MIGLYFLIVLIVSYVILKKFGTTKEYHTSVDIRKIRLMLKHKKK